MGLCLDTFQTAGGEYGDPTTETGRIETIGGSELGSRWRRSLDELERTIPSNEIYLLQISDAYMMQPPIKSQSQRERSVWSHDYRPLPYDGGYLPIQEVLRAVFGTGFRGWLSVEVFDSKPKQGISMEDYTKTAMQSLTRMLGNISTAG